jgi:uncharacterized protein involved in outer membrane biogenesis
VEIGEVHLRLLPRPGFDLENLVVYDAPVFGSEPLLRAPEVTAALRLTSLVRGRLEIARLDLTEPSLNLVHANGGRWNLEALLERSAHAPLAPTGKRRSEPRPAFPYIEVSSGRINFKFGQEKKPYALVNADFSLWQDSENSWGVRLKAQPFRSDLSLSDTGLLRVNGIWQRAASLRDTPLQFAIEWDRPQLGQLTKFLTGSDKGWRGAVLLDATLTGTPGALQVHSDASIRDFRRYDILNGDAITLAAHCDAQYSSADHTLHRAFCRAPVGNGSLALRGDLGLPGSRSYDLMLTAEDVPTSAVAALARRARKNLPDDLTAAGTVEGNFSMRQSPESPAGPELDGRGEIANVRLASASNKAELSAGSVPFVITSRSPAGARQKNVLAHRARLEFGPVALGTEKSAPATATGSVSRDGYSISLSGEAEIARVLRTAHLFGVPALTTAAEGSANLDLQLAGNWAGWSANSSSTPLQPQVTGTAKLRNVHVPIHGTNRIIEISSAVIQFSPDDVKVSRLTLNAAHATWTGSIELPRGCGTPSACLIHFNLSTNEAGLSDMRQWAQPNQGERPWYSVLEPDTKSSLSFLASLRAMGTLNANRLLVQHLVATQVSANVSLDAGKLKVSDLRADFLGGTEHGEWQADFTQKPAAYAGSGTLTQVSMNGIADAMHDSWISGVADGKYRLTASGLSSEDFWQSADAVVQFEIRDAVLPHLSLANDDDPLKINRFAGRAHLQEGTIEIEDGDLDSPAGEFQVSGTASLSRELDFKLKPAVGGNSSAAAQHAYTITGTLAQPEAVAASGPETQARLKP